MIKLTKLEKPDILKNNAAQWTQVLLDRLAANIKPSDSEKNRYRHPEIKAILVKETHGKCAYCESKLLHITYGDVEHIVPKSTKAEVAFEWNNLTLACDVCNTNKSDKFSHGVGFIDPYLKDPSDHFYFLGPIIYAKPGDADARLTEETLKLNRVELIERRCERMRYLRDQVEVIRHAPAHLRDTLIQCLTEEAHADKEYAAVARVCILTLLT